MQRLLLVLALAAACGGDDAPNVGGTCTATDGCDEDLTCDTSVTGGYCTASCTMPGTTAECPEGSICDTTSGTSITCVKICETADDCRNDLDCNGVSGSSIKACKPKPD